MSEFRLLEWRLESRESMLGVQTEWSRTTHCNRVFRFCLHLKLSVGEKANRNDQTASVLLQFNAKIDIKEREVDVDFGITSNY